MFKKITITIVRAALWLLKGKGERPEPKAESLKLKVESLKLRVERPKTKDERPKIGVEGGKLKVESLNWNVERPKAKAERLKIEVERGELKVESSKLRVERLQRKDERARLNGESTETKVDSLKWIPNWRRVAHATLKSRNLRHQFGIFSILLVLVFCGLGVSAQGTITNEAKPLQVGDKMPEWFWSQAQQLYGNGVTSVDNLSRYKGKLLVLDFWASWCSTCLKKWPLLDSLARVYPDELAVLLINEKRNGDDLNRIRQRMDVAITGKALVLTTIYGDSVLGSILPHHFLPHYVWISEQGVVMAITGTEFMTADLVIGMMERRLKKKNKISN